MAERQICRRCSQAKGLGAFFSLRSNHTEPQRRDPVCRQCRGEIGRGVPDEIVTLRQKEQRLARWLAELRAEIRTLKQGEKIA